MLYHLVWFLSLLALCFSEGSWWEGAYSGVYWASLWNLQRTQELWETFEILLWQVKFTFYLGLCMAQHNFLSVKNPERVIWSQKGLLIFGYVWCAGVSACFLENNKWLHLGTPANVTLFLLETDPGPPSEKGKVMWPSLEKVWGPLLYILPPRVDCNYSLTAQYSI